MPGPQSLVGRDRELDGLAALLDEADAGMARLAFVTGEPGIGKTALLAELLARAEDRGCLALHGSAAEFERELPFGLLVDALDEYLESLDPRAFSRLTTEDLGELADGLPGPARARPRLGPRRRPRRSASAPTGRSASCSSAWPRDGRWSSCSTTCTGPTAPRSSSWRTCCATRRAARVVIAAGLPRRAGRPAAARRDRPGRDRQRRRPAPRRSARSRPRTRAA